MIFDTSFLIDLMDKKDSAVKKLHELIERNEPQIITTPSIFELWSGIVRSKKSNIEKIKVLNIIKAQAILSLDQSSAEIAGEIDGSLIKQGNTIDPEDCMIAGIAKTKHQIIVSNDEHFKRINEIKVENY